MKKLILVFLSVVALSGCTKSLELLTQSEGRESLDINQPDTPELYKDIQWKVITKDNAEEVFEEMDRPVLYGITPAMYENLSKNNLDMRNYILELRTINKQYRNYYEPENNK